MLYEISKKYIFIFPFQLICMDTNLDEFKLKGKKDYFLEAVTCKKKKKVKKMKTDQPFSAIYIIFKEKFH